MTGYLIHIDGALTTEYDAVDPSVDKKLLTRLESVGYDGGKIALITGRAEKWLDQHLFPLINDDTDFLILGEYGDFRMWHKQRYWDDKAQEFAGRYRELLKERIAAIAKTHGVRVKKDDRDYEPKSGELWFAVGTGVLSARTNPHGHRFGAKVDAELVYKITREAIKESGVPEDEFDIKKTPVSTVISRKGVTWNAPHGSRSRPSTRTMIWTSGTRSVAPWTNQWPTMTKYSSYALTPTRPRAHGNF